MNDPKLCVFRFSEFEVAERELRITRLGVVVPLEPKALRVLIYLLRNPDRIIGKDELLNAVWGDTAVTENSLTRAIALLRRTLDDDIHQPRFILTIPAVGYRFIADVDQNVATCDPSTRRGYRFIGEVDAPIAVVLPPVPVEQPPAPHPHHRWWKMGAAVLAISLIALAGFVAYRWHRKQQPQVQGVLNAVPFTALPGQEDSPAFSPDGSRITFAWNGDPASGGKGYDLYVKAIGSETLLRLTQHPSEWISAAWSPDGTQIVFHRLAGADTGIYIVPALGGPERKLRSTHLPQGWIWASVVSWSFDGKWIAFTDVLPDEDHGRIYLYSAETSEIRKTENPPGCESDAMKAFAHKDNRLAFWCMQTYNEARLYSVEIPEGKPKLITAFHNYPQGLTWSADDTALIYSMGNGFALEMAEIELANGSVKGLPFAAGGLFPAVSPKGSQLAFSVNSASTIIWRKDIQHPEAPAVEVAASTRPQYAAAYSPDGRRIAFVSRRSGLGGVWVSNDDGSNLVEISNPAYESGSPEWSPDGSKVAFDSQRRDGAWEIEVADVTERIPRKLTTSLTNINRPHWSRDGKWIYFGSDEVGKMGIYRCPASGGDAVLVRADKDARVAQESSDGAILYFAAGVNNQELKKISLSKGGPGPESKVDGLSKLWLWTISPDGIYFVSADAPKSVSFYDFATRHVRPVFTVQNDFDDGLSVSPDGRWILFSQCGAVNTDIMLVNHFR
jgi:Tol biopolymer transport system component/DNA-binding winged helix-turn-helix (wHTH) protein